MSGNGARAAGIDTSVPNVARIYDYILGGKDKLFRNYLCPTCAYLVKQAIYLRKRCPDVPT